MDLCAHQKHRNSLLSCIKCTKQPSSFNTCFNVHDKHVSHNHTTHSTLNRPPPITIHASSFMQTASTWFIIANYDLEGVMKPKPITHMAENSKGHASSSPDRLVLVTCPSSWSQWTSWPCDVANPALPVCGTAQRLMGTPAPVLCVCVWERERERERERKREHCVCEQLLY